LNIKLEKYYKVREEGTKRVEKNDKIKDLTKIKIVIIL